MPSSAAERTQNARRAQLLRSAAHDGRVVTEEARKSFRASFDPPPVPGETEADKRARLRRGEAAYRAYMSEIGRRGREARAAGRAERRARLASS